MALFQKKLKVLETAAAAVAVAAVAIMDVREQVASRLHFVDKLLLVPARLYSIPCRLLISF